MHLNDRDATPDVVAVWRTMLEIHGRLIGELAPALAEHGLSISEFDVLINLSPRESCRHGDLAERVVLSRTALTRLVDRLCARGLLTREPDPSDQRGVLIRLTEAGREQRRTASRTNNRVVRAGLTGLDADGLTELNRLLHDLNHPQPTPEGNPK